MIQSYCSDLSYLADILTKLSGSYNLLANSANSFNNNSYSKKDYIEDAIGRTKDLGKVIDKVISALEVQILLYISYTNIKNEYISSNFSFNEIIESEISHHIKHLEHQSHEDKND
jgi:hypothetical protein